MAVPGGWLLGGVGVVGLAAAALLVGHSPGLGAALVGLGVGAPAVVVLVRRRAWADAALAGVGAALLTAAAVRDAGWVVAIATLAGLGALAAAVTGARRPAHLLLAPAAAALGSLRLAPVLTGLGRAAVGARRETVARVGRAAALTAVLLVVFGALFATADAVFAAYLPRPDLGLLPGRVVVGVLVGLLTLTAAHLALAPPAWPGPRDARPAAHLGEWLAPLVALDGLVLAFLAVQVGGLLGGHAHVLATQGLTYAQYARSGFGQLVAATALTLVVVAGAAHRAPRGTRAQRWATSAALGVLAVGTLGVVAAALRRMALYVDAYGLTRLRLLVLVGEVVLGVIVLLVLVAGVRWRGGWLARGSLAAVLAGVAALVAVDPDALIARVDLAAAAPLDAGYLSGLSADAVPVLAGIESDRLRACTLAGREVGDDGWPGWNLGRARAAAVLVELPGLPATADCPAPVRGEGG